VLQAVISENTHNSEKCFIQKLYSLKKRSNKLILIKKNNFFKVNFKWNPPNLMADLCSWETFPNDIMKFSFLTNLSYQPSNLL